MWKLCFMWKNVEKRFQKCGLSTILLKSSHGLSFLWIFSVLFVQVILQRFYKVCFWSRTQIIKYVIFSKMQSIRFSAMKIIEILWKLLSLMTIQKFPLLKLNFSWPILIIWVIVLTYKYHICVLLFITFHCNMSMIRDIWNLTHFSKIQIQILKKAHLGFWGVLICYS